MRSGLVMKPSAGMTAAVTPRHPASASAVAAAAAGSAWLAVVLLITAGVAVLAPGVSYATASQAGPSVAAADVGCRGVTPAVIPALGFITNPGRSQGGHLWWLPAAGGTCIGTVVEWVQYNTTATRTWRVIAYSAQHPDGQVVAQQTFTLGRGWYWWSFGVHQVFPGLSAVCITADDSFGAQSLIASMAAASTSASTVTAREKVSSICRV